MTDHSEEDSEEARRRILSLIHSGWEAWILDAAIELDVPNALWKGPKDIQGLSQELDCDRGALERLIRALTRLGVTHSDGDGMVRLSPEGRSLSDHAPQRIAAWSRWQGVLRRRSWPNLAEAVRTGSASCSIDPVKSEDFHEAMTEHAARETACLATSWDFKGARHIIDVAGGSGIVLAAVLRSAPQATGEILDRPEALGTADRFLERDESLHSRIQTTPGDFFGPLPQGGDVLLLCRVLHDWDDGDAVRILKNCRSALPPKGVLRVIERVYDDDTSEDMVRADLQMLVTYGGRERTQEELIRLIEDSFLRAREVRREGSFALIEAELG